MQAADAACTRAACHCAVRIASDAAETAAWCSLVLDTDDDDVGSANGICWMPAAEEASGDDELCCHVEIRPSAPPRLPTTAPLPSSVAQEAQDISTLWAFLLEDGLTPSWQRAMIGATLYGLGDLFAQVRPLLAHEAAIAQLAHAERALEWLRSRCTWLCKAAGGRATAVNDARQSPRMPLAQWLNARGRLTPGVLDGRSIAAIMLLGALLDGVLNPVWNAEIDRRLYFGGADKPLHLRLLHVLLNSVIWTPACCLLLSGIEEVRVLALPLCRAPFRMRAAVMRALPCAQSARDPPSLGQGPAAAASTLGPNGGRGAMTAGRESWCGPRTLALPCRRHSRPGRRARACQHRTDRRRRVGRRRRARWPARQGFRQRDGVEPI